MPENSITQNDPQIATYTTHTVSFPCLHGEVLTINPDDIYRALVCLERRKNQTAPLPTLAGASEAEATEQGCEYTQPLSAVIISRELIP